MKKYTKDELKEIFRQHQLWNADDGGEQADLSNVDFRRCDLNNINFSNISLNGSDLTYSNFTGSIITNYNLNNSILTFCEMDKRYIQISGVLSLNNIITYCVEDDIIWSNIFIGSLEDFDKEISFIYIANKKIHNEYKNIISFFKNYKETMDNQLYVLISEEVSKWKDKARARKKIREAY